MTIEDIKSKSEYGDYNTLGKMLDISPMSARARFFREDTEAIEAMIMIVENREKLIRDYKNK